MKLTERLWAWITRRAPDAPTDTAAAEAAARAARRRLAAARRRARAVDDAADWLGEAITRALRGGSET